MATDATLPASSGGIPATPTEVVSGPPVGLQVAGTAGPVAVARNIPQVANPAAPVVATRTRGVRERKKPKRYDSDEEERIYEEEQACKEARRKAKLLARKAKKKKQHEWALKAAASNETSSQKQSGKFQPKLLDIFARAALKKKEKTEVSPPFSPDGQDEENRGENFEIPTMGKELYDCPCGVEWTEVHIS